MWNLKNIKLTETDQWFTRGWWGGGKGEILIKEYKFSIIKKKQKTKNIEGESGDVVLNTMEDKRRCL